TNRFKQIEVSVHAQVYTSISEADKMSKIDYRAQAQELTESVSGQLHSQAPPQNVTF
ncbi:Hypothetical predicted protein, partial [Pelobates cultripes]